MSELIRNWLLSITGASMLLAVAEHIVQEGINRKIVRLAGGLVLTLLALNPLLRLDENTLGETAARFELEVQKGSEALELKQDFLYESIIEEKTEAYILDKAKKLGLDCHVSVSVAWNGDVPVPHSASVRGNWTQQQKDELSQMMEAELGISKSLQRFEETE